MHVRIADIADTTTLAHLMLHVHRLHVTHDPRAFHLDEKDAFLEEASADFAQKLTGENHTVWLAWVNDEPAGYLLLEWRSWPRSAGIRAGSAGYVHHVSVAPAHQRKGVARALFGAATAAARARGCAQLRLDVHSAWNSVALATFEALGFREARRVMLLPLA